MRESPPGVHRSYALYVIDLRKRLIAFEERKPEIARQGFVAALRKIVSAGNWEVDLLGDKDSFDAWLDDVDRVTRFRATLVPPNHFTNAMQVRALVTEPNSERTAIEASNRDDQRGLTVRGTILEAAAHHADLGNGDYRVSGLKGAAHRFFYSARRLLSRSVEVGVTDSDEIVQERIVEHLAEIDVPTAPEDNRAPV